MADVELSNVEQIAIIVHDVDRAVRFYRDILGLPFLFQVPNMAFFQCGEVRLMLGIPSAPEFDHPSSIIYYHVADIEATHQALVSRGAHLPEHTAPGAPGRGPRSVDGGIPGSRLEPPRADEPQAAWLAEGCLTFCG